MREPFFAARDAIHEAIQAGDAKALAEFSKHFAGLPMQEDAGFSADDLTLVGETLMRLTRAARSALESALQGFAPKDEASREEAAPLPDPQALIAFAKYAEELMRVPLQHLSLIDSPEVPLVLEALGRESVGPMIALRSWLLCALAQVPKGAGARSMIVLTREFLAQDPDAADKLQWDNVASVLREQGEYTPGLSLALSTLQAELPNLRWELCWIIAANAADAAYQPVFDALRNEILMRLKELELGVEDGKLPAKHLDQANQARAVLCEACSLAPSNDGDVNDALQVGMKSDSPFVLTGALCATIRRGGDVDQALLKQAMQVPECAQWIATACAQAGRMELLPQAPDSPSAE